MSFCIEIGTKISKYYSLKPEYFDVTKHGRKEFIIERHLVKGKRIRRAGIRNALGRTTFKRRRFQDDMDRASFK